MTGRYRITNPLLLLLLLLLSCVIQEKREKHKHTTGRRKSARPPAWPLDVCRRKLAPNERWAQAGKKYQQQVLLVLLACETRRSSA